MNHMWVQTNKLLDKIEREIRTRTELAPTEAHVLASLYDQNGQKASVLAKAIDRPATSFTPILDGLEKRKLIQRRPDKDDRRVVRIYLAGDGYDLALKASQAIAEIDEEMAAEVPYYLPVPALA